MASVQKSVILDFEISIFGTFFSTVKKIENLIKMSKVDFENISDFFTHLKLKYPFKIKVPI